MDDLYRELVIEAAEDRTHRGQLAHFDRELHGRNASCGDQVQIWIRWAEEKVSEVGWDGEGCIISQAGMSVLSAHLIGKTRAEIVAMDLSTVLDLLHFDSISPGRLKCVLLGLETIKKAL